MLDNSSYRLNYFNLSCNLFYCFCAQKLEEKDALMNLSCNLVFPAVLHDILITFLPFHLAIRAKSKLIHNILYFVVYIFWGRRNHRKRRHVAGLKKIEMTEATSLFCHHAPCVYDESEYDSNKQRHCRHSYCHRTCYRHTHRSCVFDEHV